MIDEEATFKQFGYYPKDLKIRSGKAVVAVCNNCSVVRYPRKSDYVPLCKVCAYLEKKGKAAPHVGSCKCPFCLAKNSQLTGENHPNYKDGRTLKAYFCIDCGKSISYSCGLYYGGHCRGCGNKLRGLPGELSPHWKGGITDLSLWIRSTAEYLNWKITILERDKFTCQECGCGDRTKLHVHHIKPFSITLKEFLQEYNQFSPIEDKETLVRLAQSHEPFWNLKNGQTLCENCHDEHKGETLKLIKESKKEL